MQQLRIGDIVRVSIRGKDTKWSGRVTGARPTATGVAIMISKVFGAASEPVAEVLIDANRTDDQLSNLDSGNRATSWGKRRK